MSMNGANRDLLILHETDNVAVTLRRFAKGETAIPDGASAEQVLPSGHKVALAELDKGDAIRKFGQVIGYATQAVKLGEHVHVHNAAFGAHDQAYEIGIDYQPFQRDPVDRQRTFMGYRRADGSAGTRNYIALLATVNCSATVVRRIADAVNHSGMLDEFPNVDGVIALAHGTGCGMDIGGEGYQTLQRVLWGHATHPNVAASVFIGLGCEVMQVARMKQMFGSSGQERFHGMTIQDSGGTRKTIEQGIETVRALLPQANAVKREPIPVSELLVGLQCGGSDGYSGITANPALGHASDLLVRMGGTTILSETPEIYGAEHLLTRRAVAPEVGEKLIDRIKWWENYTAINGGEMDNNPSPGNKRGGLTTILEKSLGAVAKGGTAPLSGVYKFAEPITSPGFVYMDSPGYDPCSVTGQIASGATMIVFTTGRGSVSGYKPSPCIKLATNNEMYQRMAEDMDINCGDIIDGVSIEAKGAEILEKIIAVASGQRTLSEELGFGGAEFVPWQIGAVM